MKLVPVEYLKNAEKLRMVPSLGFRFAEHEAECAKPLSDLP